MRTFGTRTPTSMRLRNASELRCGLPRPTLWAGYTSGMKTAISVPDELFEEVERLARRLNRSRSRLFADAVREYIARHDPETVTAALDRVYAESNGECDAFNSAAAARILERTDW